MNEQWMVAAVIAAVVLIAIAVVVWIVQAKRRSDGLRKQFGPEYEHTVETAGSRKKAEAELVERERHVRELDIRPLSAVERDHYRQTWRDVQSEFVDRPQAACEKADRLIAEVMNLRGYPAGDFEQRTSEISVDHPQVVQTYRTAHSLTMGNAHGAAATENLRQAMVHYRELFEELVNDSSSRSAPAPRRSRMMKGGSGHEEPGTQRSPVGRGQAQGPGDHGRGSAGARAFAAARRRDRAIHDAERHHRGTGAPARDGGARAGHAARRRRCDRGGRPLRG